MNSRKTIVFVDDEPEVRDIASMVLRSVGYEVHAAGNGNDALWLLHQHSPQVRLVITDFLMPGMSGLELANTVRELHPNVSIILASGYADLVPDRREDLNFVDKPFDFELLLKKVETIFAHGQVLS